MGQVCFFVLFSFILLTLFISYRLIHKLWFYVTMEWRENVMEHTIRHVIWDKYVFYFYFYFFVLLILCLYLRHIHYATMLLITMEWREDVRDWTHMMQHIIWTRHVFFLVFIHFTNIMYIIGLSMTLQCYVTTEWRVDDIDWTHMTQHVLFLFIYSLY